MATKARTTPKQIIDALKRHGGFVTAAAKSLGIGHSALSLRISKNPELQNAREEITESFLDLAENALIKKVQSGDLGAICFYLKCKGKKRGYVERQEIQMEDAPTPVKVIILGVDGRKQHGNHSEA